MKITDELYLENPTYDVRGIFDSVDEEGVVNFKYLLIHFQEGGKGTIHSRYWVVETENIEEEISKIEKLKFIKL